jgi:hypothetical protein
MLALFLEKPKKERTKNQMESKRDKELKCK